MKRTRPLLLLLPVVLWACDDEAGVLEPPREISSLSVTAPERELTAGTSMRLEVVAADSRGIRFVEPPVQYTSSAPDVASVSGDGVVTGQRAGNATITVTGGSSEASVTITVIPGRASSLALGLESGGQVVGGVAMVQHGGEGQLSVDATDAAGNATEGRFVNFYSLEPSIVSVDATGVFDAVFPGTARVVAELDALVDTLEFQVAPSETSLDHVEISPASPVLAPGDVVEFEATAINWDGEVIPVGAIMPNGEPLTFEFSSSAPAVLSVDPEDGSAEALYVGAVNVTALIPSLPPDVASAVSEVSVGSITSISTPEGRPGTVVTLTGTSLDEVVEVAFGGVPAFIGSQSAGAIQTWVPVGGESGPVTVSGLTGEEASPLPGPADFTVGGPGDVFDDVNDDPTTAPVVTPGFENPSLFADVDTDREDWFILDMDGATAVTITMPFDASDFDLYLVPIAGDGSPDWANEVAHSWFDNPEVISVDGLDPNASYYVLVDAYDGTGAYGISITTP